MARTINSSEGESTGRRRTRFLIGIGIILVVGLFIPRPAKANILCTWFMYCLYESPGFRITVIDKETGKPLPDVHALAVWLSYGAWGTKGPLMALEAVSGPDGVLTFPGWGPLRWSPTGLVPARDPAISLFKEGYKAQIIYNAAPPGAADTTRVRPFFQEGGTFALEPFQGDLNQWVEQLRQAAFPPEIGRVSQYDPEGIRRVYLSRWRRVRVDLERLPRNQGEVEQLKWSLEGSSKGIEGGGELR